MPLRDLRDLEDGLRRIARTPRRLKTATSYFRDPAREIGKWLLFSKEIANFTYELDATNRAYLASFVSVVTGAAIDDVEQWMRELDDDDALRRHVVERTRASRDRTADAEARYGRRIGWYAFARALKPKLVVETGVEKGLGACVLCRALERNAAEGKPGRYVGIDIDEKAGVLLGDRFRDVGEVRRGDAISVLATLGDGERVDLYINDSDHRASYEASEYEAAAPHLASTAVIIGDNAHVTDALFRFAHESGRRFLYFQEKPSGHWYPGGGIGVAFPAAPRR